jgi:hypothetical protein
MDKLHCDFCCDPSAVPVAYYGCPDFTTSVFISVGDWYACEDCDKLISVNDLLTLRRRVAAYYIAQYESTRARLKLPERLLVDKQLAATYQEFAKKQTGRVAIP